MYDMLSLRLNYLDDDIEEIEYTNGKIKKIPITYCDTKSLILPKARAKSMLSWITF